MGYDITFHPISENDIQRFLFDVAHRPELAHERASESASDSESRRLLLDMYDTILATLCDTLKLSRVSQSETINMIAAQIAGLRHPYWYARNTCIGELNDPKIDALFEPLSALKGAPASFRAMREGTKIFLNYSARALRL